MPAVLVGQLLRVLFGVLIVVAELDQVRALRPHGCVLLAAVAVRYDEVGGHIEAACGEGYRLAMIATSGGNQTRYAAASAKQFCRIDHGGTGLEGADRSMVLMFHPYFGSEPFAQQRPDNLRRGRHHRIHKFLRRSYFVNCG